MSNLVFKKEWLDIIKSQENKLKFTSFSREDAFDVGVRIIRLAKDKYKGAITASIIEDNMIVFYHKMQGSTLDNDVWIFKKQNVSKATGISSLQAFAEIESGLREPSWQERQSSFVACGGCYPLRISQLKPYIFITVSGLEHYADHQIIVDALAEHKGTTVEEIVI